VSDGHLPLARDDDGGHMVLSSRGLAAAADAVLRRLLATGAYAACGVVALEIDNDADPDQDPIAASALVERPGTAEQVVRVVLRRRAFERAAADPVVLLGILEQTLVRELTPHRGPAH